MATDVTTLDDARLFAAEDGLHQMFDLRINARADVSDIVKAFDVLTSEMATRGLVYAPLAASASAPRRRPGRLTKATITNARATQDASHFGDDDGDDDEDSTNDARIDDDNDGGTDNTPSADTNTTRGPKPSKSSNREEGPWVKKGVGGAGADPNGNADSAKGVTEDDDGLRQKGKTKSGKGGNKGRTVRDGAGDGSETGIVGDEDETHPDDGRWVKKGIAYTPHVYAPDVFTKADPDAAVDVDPPNLEENADKSTGSLKDNAPDHGFHAVRNICRICRRPAEDHVGKAVGADGSIFKAVSDDTVDDRKAGADAGIALPDGSFHIPDEAHLHQAIRLVGQAADPQAAMNHIIERAQAMGLESALPPAWRALTAAGMPEQAQVGPGAFSQGAAASAGGPPGAPGSKAKTAPGAAPPAKPTAPNVVAPPQSGGTGDGPTAPGAPGANSGPESGSNGGAPPAIGADVPSKPGALKRTVAAIAKALGARDYDEAQLLKELELHLDPTFEYAVVKANAEDRFTLGPVYMPNHYDAHGEWATAEDLQKSVWDYVAETGADRRVYLQHSERPAGEWLEIVSWPQDVTARMVKSIDGVQKSVDTTFPAGTVYMGVRWEPWAYEDVKKGKISGFSMGGYSRRIDADIPA